MTRFFLVFFLFFSCFFLFVYSSRRVYPLYIRNLTQWPSKQVSTNSACGSLGAPKVSLEAISLMQTLLESLMVQYMHVRKQKKKTKTFSHFTASCLLFLYWKVVVLDVPYPLCILQQFSLLFLMILHGDVRFMYIKWNWEFKC